MTQNFKPAEQVLQNGGWILTNGEVQRDTSDKKFNADVIRLEAIHAVRKDLTEGEAAPTATILGWSDEEKAHEYKTLLSLDEEFLRKLGVDDPVVSHWSAEEVKAILDNDFMVAVNPVFGEESEVLVTLTADKDVEEISKFGAPRWILANAQDHKFFYNLGDGDKAPIGIPVFHSRKAAESYAAYLMLNANDQLESSMLSTFRPLLAHPDILEDIRREVWKFTSHQNEFYILIGATPDNPVPNKSVPLDMFLESIRDAD